MTVNTSTTPQNKSAAVVSLNMTTDGRLSEQSIAALQANGKPDSATVAKDWVWVPTEQVMLTQVFVPGKGSDWLQALPYVLEESLAQPIEDLHFGVLNRETKGELAGQTSVAVVEKSRMQQWIAELNAYDLNQAQLIADCFKVPYFETSNELKNNESEPFENEALEAKNPLKKCQAWYIFNEKQPENSVMNAVNTEERLLVRTSPFTGFAAMQSWGEQLIEAASNETSPTQMHRLDSLPAASFSPMARKQLGLRQGAFLPSGKTNPFWRIWKAPIVIVGLIVVLAYGQMGYQQYGFETEQKQFKQQTLALFKQLFPDVKRVVNIRAQTKTRLSGSSKSNGAKPIALLQTLEPILKSYLNQKRVTVKEIKWTKSGWQLLLTAKQSQSLQDLTDQFNKQSNASLKIKSLAANQAEGVINVTKN